MKILVIGRAQPKDIWNVPHQVFYRPSSWDTSASVGGDFGIMSIKYYHLVFQHVGPANEEAKDAVQKWIASGEKHKVILFSGGSSPEWEEESARLEVPFMGGLPTAEDILDKVIRKIPDEQVCNAHEVWKLVGERRGMETLMSLAMLCQGYLVVRAAQGDLDQGGQESITNEALKQMGWYDLDENQAWSLQEGAAYQILSRDWWLTPFTKEDSIDVASVSENAMLEGRGNVRAAAHVKEFIETNIGEEKLSDATAVAKCYLALVELLGGTRCGG